MLKEYTLKLIVQVGGETEAVCDEQLNEWMANFTYEVTHEEVVEVDPWMIQIELDKFPPVEPQKEDV